jgi:polyhydroxyalkanoate synthase
MTDIPHVEQTNSLKAWNDFVQRTLNISPNNNLDGVKVATRNGDTWLKLINQMWQSNPYKGLMSPDPQESSRTFMKLWSDTLANSFQTWNNYAQFVQQYSELLRDETLHYWVGKTPAPHLVEPDKGDKRFSAPDWEQNPVFDALKQGYLLAATTMLKNASQLRGLDEKMQQRLTFYLRQFLDAISPSNFFFTNPQVIHETIQTAGQNLVAGTQHLLRDIQNGQIKLTDTDSFAPGQNLAITPGQVIYRNRMIELIQYKPTTETVYEYPILFVPHWINKFYILDLQPQNSMIKFLLDQGFTVFVISWKNPDSTMQDLTYEDYLTLGPLTALDVVKELTGSNKVNTVGYCIGGTLLSMTLPYLKAIGDESVNSATFFVTLQDFSDVGEMSVFIDEPQVAMVDEQMEERGFLDSRQMATMFNLLRDNDLIWSNVVNNYLLGKEPPAFDLLYWNNDGTRMAPLAHSFYMHNTYLENNLIKPGKIVLKGVPIDLGKITQDVYAVGAEQDHLVPWKSAWRVTRLTGGKVRFVVGGSGHIAGIIQPPSKGRGYWTNDKPAATADEWFAQAEAHKGSWWGDWANWLKQRSGQQVAPPSLGNKKYPPLAPAPGSYVLEK